MNVFLTSRPVGALTALVVALGLVGCSSDVEAVSMPDVTGLALDTALSDIERAGFGDDVELLGGGMFGIVDEANWQVCEQLPIAGESISATPRLTVDRSCDEESTDSETPSSSEVSETPAADADADAALAHVADRTRTRFLEAWGVDTEMDLLDAYLDDPIAPTYAIVQWEDVGGWVRVYVQEDISEDEAFAVGKQILGLTCDEVQDLMGIIVRGTDGLDINVIRSDMPLCA